MNGSSQSVRLPLSCRFEPGTRSVRVRKIGRAVILEPLDPLTWDPAYWAALEAMPPMDETVVPIPFEVTDIEGL
jgi:virulence-associated protein VagC